MRFSADSPAEFSVQPRDGILAPYGAEEGTQFVVSAIGGDAGVSIITIRVR